MRRFVSFGPALVVLLTVLMVLVAGPGAIHRMQAAQVSAQIILAQNSLDDDDILERLNAAVRNVARSVKPSVVHIDAGSLSTRRGVRVGGSTGTGWVYDERGHIVTNLHVVRGAREITVQFANGRQITTEPIHGQPFVGDPFTDIAVLRVPPFDGLFPARRATNIQPEQGDRVYAFGSPFGFKFSMSEGIISGLGRDPMTAVEFRGFTNFIQTDAAVNPGNSGGPLVDIRGRVVGMNVAIATGRESQGTNEGQSAGISFAIPLGTIESTVRQLIERGKVSRGFLGIQWAGRDDGELEFDDRIGRRGVRIASVVPEGPSAAAGLKAGDFITDLQGQPVGSWEGLRATVTSIFPGEPIQVRVWREGVAQEFSVTLGEFPAEDLAHDAGRIGLFRFGILLSESRGRPFIRAVVPDSAAAEAGFRQGQVLIRVGERAVEGPRDVYVAVVEEGLLQGWAVPVQVGELEEVSEEDGRRIGISAELNRRELEMRLAR